VTVCEQVVELVQQSVIIQVRVVELLHAVPNSGLVLKTEMVMFVPQQASNAVGGSNVTAVPHWMVLFGAQVTTGGVVSVTVMTSVQVEVFVQQSCACQVMVRI
jgi:hypothetical protein